MGFFDKFKKKQVGGDVPQQQQAAPAAAQTPTHKIGDVDLSEFTAEERRIMDDALTFMANFALSGGMENGNQVAADCSVLSVKLSGLPAGIAAGKQFLTAAELAKAGFSLSVYRQSIPQLVEANPQYRAHKDELMRDYSFYLPDLILKMSQYMGR